MHNCTIWHSWNAEKLDTFLLSWPVTMPVHLTLWSFDHFYIRGSSFGIVWYWPHQTLTHEHHLFLSPVSEWACIFTQAESLDPNIANSSRIFLLNFTCLFVCGQAWNPTFSSLYGHSNHIFSEIVSSGDKDKDKKRQIIHFFTLFLKVKYALFCI